MKTLVVNIAKLGKKYAAGAAALAMVALLFSFTIISDKAAEPVKATVVEDLVWFPATTTDCTTPGNLGNYNTSAGVLISNGSNPYGCSGNTYCCAIVFPLSDCTENEDGTYTLNTSHGTGSIFRKN